MQANSEATSEAVKKWIKSNGRGTHGTIASAEYDTEAEDAKAEMTRVRQALIDESKKKL
ncbi:unnamed protein product [Cercospora beticola]|nr:unnamed protein product [Cercospora beticola]